jgi:hypothetical protein
MSTSVSHTTLTRIGMTAAAAADAAAADAGGYVYRVPQTLVVMSSDNGGPVDLAENAANNWPKRGGKYSLFEGKPTRQTQRQTAAAAAATNAKPSQASVIEEPASSCVPGCDNARLPARTRICTHRTSGLDPRVCCVYVVCILLLQVVFLWRRL